MYAGFYERLTLLKFVPSSILGDPSMTETEEFPMDASPSPIRRRSVEDHETSSNPSKSKSKINTGKLVRFLCTVHRQSLGSDLQAVIVVDDESYVVHGSKFAQEHAVKLTIAMRTQDNGSTWWPYTSKFLLPNHLHTPALSSVDAVSEEIPSKESDEALGQTQAPVSHQTRADTSAVLRDPSWWAGDTVQPKEELDDTEDSGSSDKKPKLPFHGLRYPSIETGETNFGAISKAGIHTMFTRNRIHFLGSLICAILCLAFACGILGYTAENVSLCCQSANETLDVMVKDEVMKSEVTLTELPHCGWVLPFAGLRNKTDAVIDMFDRCTETCDRLKVEGIFTFAWATPSDIGSIAIAVILLSSGSILASLLANFFLMRAVALKVKVARFWKIVWVGQVLVGGGLVAACIIHLQRMQESGTRSLQCTEFPDKTAQICRTAQQTCNLAVVAGVAHARDILQPLTITELVLAGLSLLCALIPPMPSSDAINELPVLNPDTRACRPGEFAPDGLSKDDRALLRAKVKAEFDEKHEQNVQREIKLKRAADDHNVFASTQRRRVTTTRVGGRLGITSPLSGEASPKAVHYTLEDKMGLHRPVLGSTERVVAEVAHRVLVSPNVGRDLPLEGNGYSSYPGDPTKELIQDIASRVNKERSVGAAGTD